MASPTEAQAADFADDPELTWDDENNATEDLSQLRFQDPAELQQALERVAGAKSARERNESLWQIQRDYGGLRALGYLLRLRRQRPHSEARFLEYEVREPERRVLYKAFADRIAQDPELLLALHSGFPDSFPSPASDPLRPLKARLRALSQQLSPVHTELVRLGYEKFAEPLRQLITDCESFAFRVFVVGEFSTGKSTLINALLGREYLPTGFEPVTLAPTRIGYGREPKLFVKAFGKSEQPVEQFELLKELKLEANEVGLGAADIEYLRVEVPVPLLHNGLCLIDTPGLNDVSQRGRLIADLLQEADAVILVTAANRLLTANEQDLLRSAQSERLTVEQKRWLDVGFVAVTFTDLMVKGAKAQKEIDSRLAPLQERLKKILLELYPPRGFAQGRRFFLDATDPRFRLDVQEAVPSASPSPQSSKSGEFGGLQRVLQQFLALERGGVQEAHCRARAHTQLKRAQAMLDKLLNRHYQKLQSDIDVLDKVEKSIVQLRKDGKALAEQARDDIAALIATQKAKFQEKGSALLTRLDDELSTQKNPYDSLTDTRAAANYFAEQGQAYVKRELVAWAEQEMLPEIAEVLSKLSQKFVQIKKGLEAQELSDSLGFSASECIEISEQAAFGNAAFFVVAGGTGAVGGSLLGLGAAVLLSLSWAIVIPIAAIVGLVLLLLTAVGFEVTKGEDYLRGLVSKQIKEKMEAQLPSVTRQLGQRLRKELSPVPGAIEAVSERMAERMEEQLRQRKQKRQLLQEEGAARLAEVAALRSQIAAALRAL